MDNFLLHIYTADKALFSKSETYYHEKNIFFFLQFFNILVYFVTLLKIKDEDERKYIKLRDENRASLAKVKAKHLFHT